MSLDVVQRALEPLGLKRNGAGWMARCPAHDDSKASLSLGKGDDGRALLKCQAGCETEAVVEALGLKMSDLFPPKQDQVAGPAQKPKIVREYEYRNAKGELLYQVCRFDPKDFRQRRPNPTGGWIWNLQDTVRVLYRLPDLLKASPEAEVFIVEGEKDVDALYSLGFTATTNVGGATKWRPEYSQFLRGRRVVILPDNDEPGEQHAKHVTNSLTGIAASVRVVKLPGLPPKGDVSDWLQAGGTKEKLISITAGASEPAAFRASMSRLIGERDERIDMGRGALSFGVKFLDDALGGITKRDLIIIGAKTGAGKTDLATMIALHNSSQGRRVHYFALEAEDREIERRMKFKVLANLYYSDGSRFSRPSIRYLDWYMGRLDRLLGPYEAQADISLVSAFAKLRTFYREKSFTSKDFSENLERIKDDTDLVLLDHLHYVDGEDENENRGYKRTVQQIRDSAIEAGKPVIVVAHVRKSDRRSEQLIPSVEDFHGSSDIPKIATKGIMIAPAYNQASGQPSFLWDTYMQVSKCRLDSSLTRYAALVVFNAQTAQYESAYTLGKLTDGGKAFTHLTRDETPPWAIEKSDYDDGGLYQ